MKFLSSEKGYEALVQLNYKRKQLLKVMSEDTHNWIVMWIEEECPKLDDKGQDIDLVFNQYLRETGNTKVTKRELKKHMKSVSESYGHTWVTNDKDGKRFMNKINGETKECVYVKQSFKSRMKRLTKKWMEHIGVPEKYAWE
jgi:hypothetical protein